jgi:undecaprenyl diphosphate synthase
MPHETKQNGLVPTHVGIVMDGNRRWATARGLPPTAGHEAGAETLRKIMRKAQEMGIKNLTLYAFSTENWKRTKGEVRVLFKLMLKFIIQERAQIIKNNIRFRTIGDIKDLPAGLRKALQELMAVSKRNNKFILNVALDYGGRSEIVRAVKKILRKGASAVAVTEEAITSNLDTAGQPDPDLIIRTGGEQRLSNFMMWQASYSELYFSKRLWPDFGVKDFEEAIQNFQQRKRRFGK